MLFSRNHSLSWRVYWFVKYYHFCSQTNKSVASVNNLGLIGKCIAVAELIADVLIVGSSSEESKAVEKPDRPLLRNTAMIQLGVGRGYTYFFFWSDLCEKRRSQMPDEARVRVDGNWQECQKTRKIETRAAGS